MIIPASWTNMRDPIVESTREGAITKDKGRGSQSRKDGQSSSGCQMNHGTGNVRRVLRGVAQMYKAAPSNPLMACTMPLPPALHYTCSDWIVISGKCFRTSAAIAALSPTSYIPLLIPTNLAHISLSALCSTLRSCRKDQKIDPSNTDEGNSVYMQSLPT
jgi:hypothetical protein